MLAYAGMGAFIQLRRLPSIVVTLGASFVWLGLAVLVLPSPGGDVPAWLTQLVRLHPPFVPLPIVVAVLLALFGHWLFMRTSYGVVLRGIGSTPVSLRRAGWSLLAARSTLFGLAGVFGVIAGLLVTGLNTSGDATIGASYTLLSVAAVIIGGGRVRGWCRLASGSGDWRVHYAPDRGAAVVHERLDGLAAQRARGDPDPGARHAGAAAEAGMIARFRHGVGWTLNRWVWSFIAAALAGC